MPNAFLPCAINRQFPFPFPWLGSNVGWYGTYKKKRQQQKPPQKIEQNKPLFLSLLFSHGFVLLLVSPRSRRGHTKFANKTKVSHASAYKASDPCAHALISLSIANSKSSYISSRFSTESLPDDAAQLHSGKLLLLFALPIKSFSWNVNWLLLYTVFRFVFWFSFAVRLDNMMTILGPPIRPIP